MSTATFSRFQCWKDDRISNVINLDAIAVDPVNFMATHTPLSRIEYIGRSPEGLNNTGEENLLEEIHRLSDEDKHAFIIVEGMPGSGKSHLIRWLKERYLASPRAAENRDVVLLIERANSSLRGALRQIVESQELRNTGIYDERMLADQINRLQRAADLLSGEALNESLLNALQVAALEVRIPEEQGMARLLQNNAAASMLLDQTFREHLKRPNGPIERLVRHLAEGRNTQQAYDELPGFQPEDFLLDMSQLRALDLSGYQEVRLLAKQLAVQDRPQLRKSYADFLNRRLNHAVGRTTSLTADNLKQVFNDIRRALRRRGYHLVLFIEDITSFTGIDAGLIDVLATQHTGQENVNFARLTSIVGITNDYYLSRFPDNMKQRVTHHLQLSTANNASMLLERPGSVAELSSRYLNAMRLDEPTLQHWMTSGADPAELPNACQQCPFRQECHSSFGSVPIHDSVADDDSHIGLYPFSEPALTTMLNGLEQGTRTPRSLLVNVLESVLVRHGPKVRRGEFPPQRLALGTHFQAPTLQSTGGHDRVLRDQGGQDFDRLESLLVFWGDQSVTSCVEDGKRLVGELPEGVFKAFDLPFIAGTSTTVSQGPITPPISPPPVDPPVGPTPRVDPVIEDLTNWRSGRPLQRYEELRRALFTALKDGIDWESHLISPAQLDGRLEARRIRIEGQVGKTTGDTLEFFRSNELYDALRAVHALRASESLESPDLGAYLLTLRIWIDHVEDAVVDFVHKPISTAVNAPALYQVVAADALMLSILEGQFVSEQVGSQAIVSKLLNQSATYFSSEPADFERAWTMHLNDSREHRSPSWTALRRTIGAARSYDVWASLARAINRSQGGFSNVRFLDADIVWTEVERIKKARWQVHTYPGFGDPDSLAGTWRTPVRVFTVLQKSLEDAFNAERAFIQEHKDHLDAFLEGDTPDEVVEVLGELFRKMRQRNLSLPFDRNPLTANIVTDHHNRLTNLLVESQGTKSVARLSNADRTIKQVSSTLSSFKAIQHLMNQFETSLSQRLQEGERSTLATHTGATTRAVFDELLGEIAQGIKHVEREGVS